MNAAHLKAVARSKRALAGVSKCRDAFRRAPMDGSQRPPPRSLRGRRRLRKRRLVHRDPSGESACKPGSVESNHSSRTHVAVSLEQPTRKRVQINALRVPFDGRPRASLFGLAPGGVCRAAECCHRRGALLPHPFTLTGSHDLHRERLGGLLSVALSVGSRPPGVTWHLIRRSPDFPPPSHQAKAAIARPTPRAHLTGGRRF